MAWSTKEAQREYYIRNREHIIKRNRKYKDTHVELRHRDMKSHLRYILGKARLRKKHEFDITPEDLYELWDKQNGLCAYSKQPLTNEVNHLQMASLDRIDSKQGYVKSNIQLLCFAVNKMKQEFSEEDFFKFCFFITDTEIKSHSICHEPSKTDPLLQHS